MTASIECPSSPVFVANGATVAGSPSAAFHSLVTPSGSTLGGRGIKIWGPSYPSYSARCKRFRWDLRPRWCARSRLPVPVGGPVCDTQTDRLIGIAHGSSCPGGRLPGQSAADSSHLYHRSALAPAHRRSITRPPPRLASAYPIGQARHNKRPDYPCTFGHYVDKAKPSLSRQGLRDRRLRAPPHFWSFRFWNLHNSQLWRAERSRNVALAVGLVAQGSDVHESPPPTIETLVGPFCA